MPEFRVNAPYYYSDKTALAQIWRQSRSLTSRTNDGLGGQVQPALELNKESKKSMHAQLPELSLLATRYSAVGSTATLAVTGVERVFIQTRSIAVSLWSGHLALGRLTSVTALGYACARPAVDWR
ncbi:hypothetical protein VTN00DRAFT_5717 [Thermoascus crustaceus]|uniref:uncharacterized protein n=1 Tax=Thermoascus crustaceus TaxID=5088 RepID=UPI003742C00D